MVKAIQRRYKIKPVEEMVLYETDTQKIVIPENKIEIFVFEKHDGYWYEKNAISITYADENDISTRKLVFSMAKIGPFARQGGSRIFSSLDELYQETGIRLTEDDMDAQASRLLACKMIGHNFLYGDRFK